MRQNNDRFRRRIQPQDGIDLGVIVTIVVLLLAALLCRTSCGLTLDAEDLCSLRVAVTRMTATDTALSIIGSAMSLDARGIYISGQSDAIYARSDNGYALHLDGGGAGLYANGETYGAHFRGADGGLILEAYLTGYDLYADSCLLGGDITVDRVDTLGTAALDAIAVLIASARNSILAALSLIAIDYTADMWDMFDSLNALHGPTCSWCRGIMLPLGGGIESGALTATITTHSEVEIELPYLNTLNISITIADADGDPVDITDDSIWIEVAVEETDTALIVVAATITEADSGLCSIELTGGSGGITSVLECGELYVYNIHIIHDATQYYSIVFGTIEIRYSIWCE